MLDELSMVRIRVFQHIVATISKLPIGAIVLLAGDDKQLQPIEKVDDKIKTTQTVMSTRHNTGAHLSMFMSKFKMGKCFFLLSQQINNCLKHCFNIQIVL